MNNRLFAILICLATVLTVATASAQSSVDRYLQHVQPIGSAKLTFPGPNGGYTLAHLPTREVMEWGDTVISNRAFLIDLNLSHDGLFLSPDTVHSVTGNTPFEFVFSKGHIIHAGLSPTHTHEEYLNFDTTFDGVIGYGLLKQFITVFDFKNQRLTIYPLYSQVDVSDTDASLMQLPLIDDAKVTYCHCEFHTIWLDATAPPFQPGHVQLAFQQPLSQIFADALDKKTSTLLDKQYLQDSLSGVKRPLGLSLTDFRVRMLSGQSDNLAGRSPHRIVAGLPKEYHDLSVPLLGTFGTDILRTYSALIIDPSRQKLIFVK
ncbi:MAG: hypothetical protein Q8922_04335 [Bacteroidota bacterium]|nr:hypothetical protein [Bacteroidota bacterium]MDP4231808.1 hypothetical protein [Bacteroidota bacterium]MDP4242694.1 hypothetical protein [Bacteroidota bacterium]MDP4287145.1 hypothetical protein [Bacteroidota bacterium]